MKTLLIAFLLCFATHISAVQTAPREAFHAGEIWPDNNGDAVVAGTITGSVFPCLPELLIIHPCKLHPDNSTIS